MQFCNTFEKNPRLIREVWLLSHQKQSNICFTWINHWTFFLFSWYSMWSIWSIKLYLLLRAYLAESLIAETLGNSKPQINILGNVILRFTLFKLYLVKLTINLIHNLTCHTVHSKTLGYCYYLHNWQCQQ